MTTDTKPKRTDPAAAPHRLGPLGYPRNVGDVMRAGADSRPVNADLSGLAPTLARRGHTVLVADLEVPGAPVWALCSDVVVTPETHLGEAARLMADHGLAQLVVVDSADGRALGVVTRHDVFEAIEMGSD